MNAKKDFEKLSELCFQPKFLDRNAPGKIATVARRIVERYRRKNSQVTYEAFMAMDKRMQRAAIVLFMERLAEEAQKRQDVADNHALTAPKYLTHIHIRELTDETSQH